MVAKVLKKRLEFTVMRQSAWALHPCSHGISVAAAVVWGVADTDASLAPAIALPPV